MGKLERVSQQQRLEFTSMVQTCPNHLTSEYWHQLELRLETCSSKLRIHSIASNNKLNTEMVSDGANACQLGPGYVVISP